MTFCSLCGLSLADETFEAYREHLNAHHPLEATLLDWSGATSWAELDDDGVRDIP